jgi:hypothetical protein
MFDTVFLLAPTFATFALGLLLKKTGVIDQPSVTFLLKLIYSLCLPALVLSTLPYVELNRDILFLPLASSTIILITLAVSYMAGKLLSLPRPTFGVLLIGTTIMNLGVVMPFIKSFYGDDGLALLFVFDFPNGLSAYTLAYVIAGRYGESQGRAVISRFFVSPPVWALAAGLVMNILSLGFDPVSINVIHSVGELTIPLLLLALGASVSFSKTGTLKLAAGITLRMLLGLCLGFLLASAFHLGGISRAIVIICSSAPAGFNTLTYASLEKLDLDYAASLVTATMISGMLLIPVLLFVL